MPVTISAPRAGLSPPARAILKCYTKRPLGGISFRRLDVQTQTRGVYHSDTQTPAWPRSPDAPRLKRLQFSSTAAWLRPARDAPAGDDRQGVPAWMAWTPLVLVISEPGLPCRVAGLAAHALPRSPDPQGRLSAQDAPRCRPRMALLWLSQSLGLPCLGLVPSPASPPAPAPPNRAAHGRAARARDTAAALALSASASPQSSPSRMIVMTGAAVSPGPHTA